MFSFRTDNYSCVVWLLSHVQLFCCIMDYISPGFSLHGISQARKLKWDAIPSPGYLSDPGIKPHLLQWQVDSFPLRPGKPIVKETHNLNRVPKGTFTAGCADFIQGQGTKILHSSLKNKQTKKQSPERNLQKVGSPISSSL